MAAQATQTVTLGGNDLVVNSIGLGAVNPGPAANTTVCTMYSGTGAPAFTATQGSVYLRTDGSSVSTRMYINTTGSTTWTNVTTAA